MCTYHSIVRAQERTRYNGMSAIRFVENGLARGKTAEDFTQKERRYLDERPRNNCTVKVYNGYCLIVNECGECVTLYQLPEWFGKHRFYSHKEPIRNARRCAALNQPRERYGYEA